MDTPIFKEYCSYLTKYKEKYGEKTLILMEVGTFYEMYAILNDEYQTFFELRKKSDTDSVDAYFCWGQDEYNFFCLLSIYYYMRSYCHLNLNKK